MDENMLQTTTKAGARAQRAIHVNVANGKVGLIVGLELFELSVDLVEVPEYFRGFNNQG